MTGWRKRFAHAAGAAVLVLTMLHSATVRAQAGQVAVGASYTSLRSNLRPGCNCFGLQGGSGEVQVGLSQRFSLLGEVAVHHRGGLTSDRYALTQSMFSAGLRYLPLRGPVQPFGELLLGGAHAAGTLSPASTGLGGSGAFAFETGGGVLVPLGRHWRLKPAQLDYVLTTFANDASNRQNDLRFSTGVQFRLGR